jgi:phosphoribosylformylglycinamidine (FGAM) synthase-like amidotransferase family enzyme
MVKALVVCGDGINCEAESAFALEQAGASASICHINALIESPGQLRTAQLLFLPGGFSFGDEISSGKVLGVKLQHALGEPLADFVASGKVVIGICNGFQALVKMGLLPNTASSGSDGPAQQVTLSHNRQGRFINRWVWLKANPSNPFLKGIDRMMLPIRHGEGRLRVPAGSEPQWQKALAPHIAATYDTDVNGAFLQIAALTNAAGNVLGMMPHPEAFVRWTQHPAWTSLPHETRATTPAGLQILTNVVNHLRSA